MIKIDMDRTELTDKDLRIGVWTYGEVNTEGNLPANFGSTMPDDIMDIDRVWVRVGSGADLPQKEAKLERQKWIKAFPHLQNIRFLWIRGSVNQEFFDAICQMEWLEALNIFGLISINNLDKISRLKRLKHLYISSATKIGNINGLSELQELVTLQIDGFKLVRDISPITRLNSLKGLSIQGSMWKKQFIDSIEGLDQLSNLESLSLDGTKVAIKDITPVTRLKKLKALEVGYWWRKEDLILLYESLPLLKYSSVKEAVESGDFKKYLRL